MSNPLLTEAAAVYLRRRGYVTLHITVALAMALAAVVFWPPHSYLHFFRTGTQPLVLQATLVVQVLLVTCVSLVAGLDRIADDSIVRHSEWLERTALPVAVIARGKVCAAVIHTAFLTLLGLPAVVVAAGPAGTPSTPVFAGQIIVFLSGLAGRTAGMIVAHFGERNYVVRITGGWIYLALLFIATITVYPPLNPIAAVATAPAATGFEPMLESAVALAGLTLLLMIAYRVSLSRHRRSAGRQAHDA